MGMQKEIFWCVLLQKLRFLSVCFFSMTLGVLIFALSCTFGFSDAWGSIKKLVIVHLNIKTSMENVLLMWMHTSWEKIFQVIWKMLLF